MIPSLSRLSLSRIPYHKQVKLQERISLPPSITNWESWKDQAMRDFNIPEGYFDIPRVTYPPRLQEDQGAFRYLEIKTKFLLTPAALFTIYSVKHMLRQAILRNDYKMARFVVKTSLEKGVPKEEILPRINKYYKEGEDLFIIIPMYLRSMAARVAYFTANEGNMEGFVGPVRGLKFESMSLGLSPYDLSFLNSSHKKEIYISRLVSAGVREALEEGLKLVQENKDFFPEYFKSTLRSGRIDFVDFVLSYIGFPLVREVVKDVPFTYLLKIDFKDYMNNNSPTIYEDLLSSRIHRYFLSLDFNEEKLLGDSAAYGGNIYIYFYILAISYRRRKTRKTSFIYHNILTEGYYSHRNPFGFYQILQSVKTGIALLPCDIDMFTLSMYNDQRRKWSFPDNEGSLLDTVLTKEEKEKLSILIKEYRPELNIAEKNYVNLLGL